MSSPRSPRARTRRSLGRLPHFASGRLVLHKIAIHWQTGAANLPRDRASALARSSYNRPYYLRLLLQQSRSDRAILHVSNCVACPQCALHVANSTPPAHVALTVGEGHSCTPVRRVAAPEPHLAIVIGLLQNRLDGVPLNCRQAVLILQDCIETTRLTIQTHRSTAARMMREYIQSTSCSRPRLALNLADRCIICGCGAASTSLRILRKCTSITPSISVSLRRTQYPLRRTQFESFNTIDWSCFCQHILRSTPQQEAALKIVACFRQLLMDSGDKESSSPTTRPLQQPVNGSGDTQSLGRHSGQSWCVSVGRVPTVSRLRLCRGSWYAS